MGFAEAKDIESRFARYVEGLVSVIGHADRAGPLHDYLLGLVLPGERKSVEPMAAITAPERTAAQHQSLRKHPVRTTGRFNRPRALRSYVGWSFGEQARRGGD
jgi:SRSO17 transposase